MRGAPTPSGGIETRPTLHEAVRRAADLVGGFKLAARAARAGVKALAHSRSIGGGVFAPRPRSCAVRWLGRERAALGAAVPGPAWPGASHRV